MAMLPAGGTAQYYVEDFLGSSRVMTNNTGTPCYDADFTPYGGERAYINNCANTYKFEGKERDTETGNDDFGARYYSWRFGRWLSADWSAVPVAVPYANLTNPQTLNLYAMVSDDPESFADLDGHKGGGTCGSNPDPTCARVEEEEKKVSKSVITQAQNVTTKTFVDERFIPDGSGGGTFVRTYVTVVIRTDENSRGLFVKANTQTITSAYDPETQKEKEISRTDTKDLSFMQTIQAIGAENMARAFESAQPSYVSFLGKAMWQMTKDHPARVIGGSMIILGGTLALPYNKSGSLRAIGYGMAIIGGAINGLYCGAGNGPGC